MSGSTNAHSSSLTSRRGGEVFRFCMTLMITKNHLQVWDRSAF